MIPKLLYFIINFKQSNMNKFINYIQKIDNNDKTQHILSQISYCGIFDKLIKYSNIRNDFDIEINDDKNEKKKYFIFKIMKSLINDNTICENKKKSLIKEFNITNIAAKYCSNYCKNKKNDEKENISNISRDDPEKDEIDIYDHKEDDDDDCDDEDEDDEEDGDKNENTTESKNGTNNKQRSIPF